MATGVICAPPILQFTLNNGQLAAGGSILTQVGGVNAATYQDQPLTTPLPNPIPLNSRGEISNAAGASCQLFLTPNTVYTFTLSDAGGNQFWVATYVNGVQVALTQAAIGLALYPQSAAEQSAGVTPTNFAYAYGAFQRYGMDPLAVADSSPGLAAAISCNDYVFDAYPGGGNYIFNSQITVSRYPVRISGATKTAGGGTGGTRFTLQTAAGANAALLHWSATVFDTVIENTAFQWQTNTTGQFAILFDVDVRSCRIRDCTFNGGSITSSTNITAIKLTATGGTFCGDVTIERNYINNVQTGIYLGLQCTTVRVLDNELAVTLGVIPTCYGINDQATSVGVLVAGCTFEQWTYGIFVNSGGIRQFHNYFEANVTADFYWGNTRQNVSIGDISTGTPLATFTVNDSTANVVLGGSYFQLYGGAAAYYVDSIAMGASRGFIDKYTQTQGIAAYGQWNTIAYASGNFVGNGSQTWTVSSGNVLLEEYAVVGNTMYLHMEVDSSSVAGAANTQLQYTMPLVAQTSAFFPCAVRVNGTRQMAMCQSLAASKQLIIYVDATRATNWTASASNAGVSINIAVRVNA